MLKLRKRLGLLLMVVFIAVTFFNGVSFKAAAANLTIPQIKFYTQPETQYRAGDIVYFKLYSPEYSGRIQYRVVLWNDETKSYKDLWTAGDKYYTNWQPYGSEIFNLHWRIDEPGHYRITIYAKRAGIANSKTFLKDMNCDSYMAGVPFVVGDGQAPSRGQSDNVGTGRYIVINEDTQLLDDLNGTLDERYVLKGQTYELYGEDNGYYRIKVGSVFGYIPSSKVSPYAQTPKDKISVAWDYVGTKSGNKTLYDEETDYVRRNSSDLGLDVLSPTWFEMSGDAKKPSLADKGDRQYVIIAHKNGYKVWPRFAEMSSDRAYAWLSDPNLRTLIIEQLVSLARDYNVDGINLDFETLGNKNKDLYTDFVKDISLRLKQEGLTVSLDVMTPDPWNAWYNVPVVKDYVDYIMLMAYDEHYKGSDSPGSVASYPFVEKAIKGTLNQGVSSGRLILGVPFYLREFDVTGAVESKPYDRVVFTKNSGLYSSTEISDQTKWIDVKPGDEFKYISTLSLGKDKEYFVVENDGFEVYAPLNDGMLVKANTQGGTLIKSQTENLSMKTANERILSNNGTFRYDDTAKQQVGEYYKDGLKHLIWMEDKDSMAWKMDLIEQYGLKGAAGWSLYWKPSEDIWSVIKSKLK